MKPTSDPPLPIPNKDLPLPNNNSIKLSGKTIKLLKMVFMVPLSPPEKKFRSSLSAPKYQEFKPPATSNIDI